MNRVTTREKEISAVMVRVNKIVQNLSKHADDADDICQLVRIKKSSIHTGRCDNLIN